LGIGHWALGIGHWALAKINYYYMLTIYYIVDIMVVVLKVQCLILFFGVITMSERPNYLSFISNIVLNRPEIFKVESMFDEFSLTFDFFHRTHCDLAINNCVDVYRFVSIGNSLVVFSDKLLSGFVLDDVCNIVKTCNINFDTMTRLINVYDKYRRNENTI